MYWVTYGCKSSDAASIIWRDVIDRHAAVSTFEKLVCKLRHAGERPVTATEVHVGGPIVGEVLAEGACRAGAPAG